MLRPHLPVEASRASSQPHVAPSSARGCSPERAAPPHSSRPTPSRKRPASKVVGYFTEWGVYDRNYHVKNIETSGSADKLTHINYSFGNVQGGKCAMGDSYAATDKAYTADQSVDGVADTWDQRCAATSTSS